MCNKPLNVNRLLFAPMNTENVLIDWWSGLFFLN